MQPLSRILIILGILFSIYGILLMWQRFNPQRLSFRQYQVPATHASEVAPVRIHVVELGIDLPIIPASIVKNQWQTTDEGVSYLSSSPVPGVRGNSILYGHNWESLLGRLTEAQTGHTIEIYMNNNSKQTFIINSLAVVSPDRSEVLQSTNKARLTLYTCTGFLDSKRLVVSAIPADEYHAELISQR